MNSDVERVILTESEVVDLGWYERIGRSISSPSTNFTPSMTLARYLKLRSFRQLCSARSPSLNIMCSKLSRVTQPRVRVVR
jgi:hypothetical protein